MSVRTCCLSGSTPDRAPEGKLQILDDVPCYIADQNAQRNDPSVPVIIICPDVFGHSIHSKVVADDMNKESGYPVVLVDYFYGTALPVWMLDKMVAVSAPRPAGSPPLSFFQRVRKFASTMCLFVMAFPHLVPFIFRHIAPLSRRTAKIALVARVARFLQGSSSRKIGVVGYCYGGLYSLHFGALDSALISAVAIAHGEVSVEKVEKLQTPTLFVCAADDWSFPEARVVQVDTLLRARPDFSESKFRIRRFPGTYHGFAIRGDERNPAVQEAKAAALTECVKFFQCWLGNQRE